MGGPGATGLPLAKALALTLLHLATSLATTPETPNKGSFT